jgi:hypothetical protein
MTSRRSATSVEFINFEGIRIEYSADGWRLLNARTFGEAALAKARLLVEKAEAVEFPVDPDRLEPPTRLEIAEFVAKKLQLRITHRRFKRH